MKIQNSKKRHTELIRIVGQHKLCVIIAVLCMIVMATSTAASAWMIKPILENIFIEKNAMMLNLLPVIIVSIYVLRSISMYGQEYYMDYVGQSLIRELRNKLYNSIINSPLSVFEEKQIGTLVSRITYDVNIIKNMVSAAVAGSIRDVFTIISLTFVIFYRDWQMASFAFIVLPLALIPMINFGKKIRQVSTNIQDLMAKLNVFLYETFTGSKIVKAFNMENFEEKRFKKKTNQIFSIEMKNVIIKALSSPTMEFLGGIAVAFVIWYGGYQVIKNNSEPGTFFSFIGAVIMLYDPVKKLTKANNALQEGMSAVHRVFDLIESRPESSNSGLVQVQNTQHFIQYDEVSFGYGEKTILKNINFKASPGEVIAIVGRSGGGKTSMVNLIPRFYDSTKGRILIDNIDTRNISLTSLRNQIAIVTQEPKLFNDTIRNNIAYGTLDASTAEIEEVAKAAYAYNFIQNSPKLFDTIVGEFGNKLSGGEKQRICIARALLKNTPILILDEATSSLDTASEVLVQKALENLMVGRTTFVIAHRLSTIINAHTILVMSNGTIVEKGTHKELVEKHGEYYKLYKSQFSEQVIKQFY